MDQQKQIPLPPRRGLEDIVGVGYQPARLARTLREAVRIRRQLAAQRPDAFLPDLARSLDAKGSVLRENGNAAGAAATLREGVECLKPLLGVSAIDEESG